jgi:hypothetical protein
MENGTLQHDLSPAVTTLLSGAVDYAGLFPPAGLSVEQAAANYAHYLKSDHQWMLGRFVVGAARLDELYETARDMISPDRAWHVAVVVRENVYDTIRSIEGFNAEHPEMICDVLEIKAETPGMIEDAADLLPANVTCYFELPNDSRLPDLLATVSLSRQRAKIRTGGLTPDTFPTAATIVRFVRTCLAANVPFKATAGLHHPIRCTRPLTYEPDAATGSMHGFLNLFLMSGFAMLGQPVSTLVEIMDDESEKAFRFDGESVVWRDRLSLGVDQLAQLRRTGIQSFGSCSFAEPVDDLKRLGIL